MAWGLPARPWMLGLALAAGVISGALKDLFWAPFFHMVWHLIRNDRRHHGIGTPAGDEARSKVAVRSHTSGVERRRVLIRADLQSARS
jgi:hypothetical protein